MYVACTTARQPHIGLSYEACYAKPRRLFVLQLVSISNDSVYSRPRAVLGLCASNSVSDKARYNTSYGVDKRMKHNSSPTDWLRRNWPDLIIGLALIAVIAGIVMTLLSGGAMLQFGSSNRPSSSTSREAPPITLAPSSQSLSTQSNEASQSANNSSSASDASAANSESSAPLVQSAPTVQPVIPGQSTNNQAGSSGQSASSSPATPAATSAAATAATPATPAPASPAQSRSGDFVVSVGAFRNPDNADNQAQQFRAQGYNVIRSQQGEWALVFVGPYNSQSEADRVAGQIRSRGHAATVYGPNEGSAAANLSAVATSSAATSTSSAATSSAAATTSNSNAASGESRFLQVGAYAVRESSFPQRERLESLGFSVIERTNSNGLLVLLVGPFNEGELASARARLDTEGVDHFTTR